MFLLPLVTNIVWFGVKLSTKLRPLVLLLHYQQIFQRFERYILGLCPRFLMSLALAPCSQSFSSSPECTSVVVEPPFVISLTKLPACGRSLPSLQLYNKLCKVHKVKRELHLLLFRPSPKDLNNGRSLISRYYPLFSFEITSNHTLFGLDYPGNVRNPREGFWTKPQSSFT